MNSTLGSVVPLAMFRSNRILNQFLNYIANWAHFHNLFKGRNDKFALVLDNVYKGVELEPGKGKAPVSHQ